MAASNPSPTRPAFRSVDEQLGRLRVTGVGGEADEPVLVDQGHQQGACRCRGERAEGGYPQRVQPASHCLPVEQLRQLECGTVGRYPGAGGGDDQVAGIQVTGCAVGDDRVARTGGEQRRKVGPNQARGGRAVPRDDGHRHLAPLPSRVVDQEYLEVGGGSDNSPASTTSPVSCCISWRRSSPCGRPADTHSSSRLRRWPDAASSAICSPEYVLGELADQFGGRGRTSISLATRSRMFHKGAGQLSRPPTPPGPSAPVIRIPAAGSARTAPRRPAAARWATARRPRPTPWPGCERRIHQIGVGRRTRRAAGCSGMISTTATPA